MSESDPRLANRIVIGLVVGAVAGTISLLLSGEFPALLSSARKISTAVLDPFGQVFLRTLFFFNMAIAAALGLAMMNFLSPGDQLDAATKAHLVAEYGGSAAQHIRNEANSPDMSLGSLVDMFMPRNLFGAFVGSNRNQLGEVLPLIAFGIPPEGIGIVLGVDRILDMTRTMVNVGSDMVTTTVVDAAARRSEQRSATRASSA